MIVAVLLIPFAGIGVHRAMATVCPVGGCSFDTDGPLCDAGKIPTRDGLGNNVCFASTNACPKDTHLTAACACVKDTADASPTPCGPGGICATMDTSVQCICSGSASILSQTISGTPKYAVTTGTACTCLARNDKKAGSLCFDGGKCTDAGTCVGKDLPTCGTNECKKKGLDPKGKCACAGTKTCHAQDLSASASCFDDCTPGNKLDDNGQTCFCVADTMVKKSDGGKSAACGCLYDTDCAWMGLGNGAQCKNT
ncbi:hypothetical protein BC830DRAFT_1175504, partial [Chytriomyces sp. MP71]